MLQYTALFILFFTHFNPISHFDTAWKRQKTKSFLTFSEAIEMEHWAKMDWEVKTIKNVAWDAASESGFLC